MCLYLCQGHLKKKESAWDIVHSSMLWKCQNDIHTNYFKHSQTKQNNQHTLLEEKKTHNLLDVVTIMISDRQGFNKKKILPNLQTCSLQYNFDAQNGHKNESLKMSARCQHCGLYMVSAYCSLRCISIYLPSSSFQIRLEMQYVAASCNFTFEWPCEREGGKKDVFGGKKRSYSQWLKSERIWPLFIFLLQTINV